MKTNEELAKKIITDNIYIVIATATKDGTPWNTPVYSSYDENYTFFWISSPNAHHSRLIKENPNIAITIFDSSQAEGTGVGVYIQAKAYELTNEQEVTHALQFHYGRKNKTPRPATDFLGDSPRRVYKAVPEKMWINTDQKANGHHVDGRTEIHLDNLLRT